MKQLQPWQVIGVLEQTEAWQCDRHRVAVRQHNHCTERVLVILYEYL
jgi:hypothetical protein